MVSISSHIKEFERLLKIPMKEINENPIKYACDYARKTGVILLLKGSTTIITDGNNVILSNTGCAGMATGGSGDVLSGIISALCASNEDMLMSASVGAYINGRAGEIAMREIGEISMVASDTAGSIGKAIFKITNPNG